MKTIQFNANNILCGNNYPIAKDLVVISTGHDDSIIDTSMADDTFTYEEATFYIFKD